MPGSALVHRGVAYRDPGALTAALAGPVSDAVRGGDAVSVVLDDECADRLRAALDDPGLAADVEFLDPTRPLRTDPMHLAAQRAAVVGQAARAGRRTLLVTQNQPALGLDDAYWLRLEAALGAALAGMPVTLYCAYRTRAAWGDAAAALVAMHGLIARPEQLDRPEANPGAHPDPAALVGELPAVVVTPPPPHARHRRVTGDDLGALRGALGDDLTAAGLDDDAAGDLVYATSEVVTNALEHGGGSAQVWTWAGRDAAGAAEVVCLVADAGRITDPFPGVVPPPVDQDRGRGLWLARVLCDSSAVSVGPEGTRVRLARRPVRSEPTTRQLR